MRVQGGALQIVISGLWPDFEEEQEQKKKRLFFKKKRKE